MKIFAFVCIKQLFTILSFVTLITSVVQAEISLSGLFGDGMVIQREMPVPVWGWGQAGEQVTVKASWQGQAAEVVVDNDGRWKVELQSTKPGQPQSLTISSAGQTITINDILVGDVWVCSGQSNMEWPLSKDFNAKEELKQANHPEIRLFSVVRCVANEPKENCQGQWKECTTESAANFSAVGYYFAKEIQNEIGVPIGLIENPWGGTPVESWSKPETLKNTPDFKYVLDKFQRYCDVYPKKMKQYQEARKKYLATAGQKNRPSAPRTPIGPGHPNQPGGLYNGMTAPLLNANIRGVLWYQGEANTREPEGYDKLFQTLITDWRQDWRQPKLPFLFVQLASSTGYGMGITLIREQQLQTMLALDNTGMAVTMDIGDAKSHHPLKKAPVGHRLACWALAGTYGRESVETFGPLYREMKIEGNNIRLFFDHVDGGLYAKDGTLTDFTICGADGVYYPAQAVIDGDTVVVSSEKVSAPVAARFCWCEYAEPNFYNKQKLPASPFRTDMKFPR